MTKFTLEQKLASVQEYLQGEAHKEVLRKR